MFRRILCPVDFSEFTNEVLDYAYGIALKFSSEIVLLHVIPNLDYYLPYESFIFQENLLGIEKKIEMEAKTSLENLLKNSEVPVKRLLKWGTPHLRIIETIKEENISLVVISSHGKGGWEQLIMGNVAEKVVRKAPCPVLVIRPKNL